MVTGGDDALTAAVGAAVAAGAVAPAAACSSTRDSALLTGRRTDLTWAACSSIADGTPPCNRVANEGQDTHTVLN